jgi:uncharacterized protein DUF4157/putative RNase toxin 14 of polymorphic toxin system
VKATQRQHDGVKTRNGSVARRRPQAKVREGAGNHHRADSFEVEAERLAARIMHGEQSVARRVSATAASDYRPTGSAGQPLPRALRETMEQALGADLRQVRIHTGTVADLAAQEYEAEAVTSGRNIYFRRGRYAPNTVAGRQLLAHELVHTLQQTGRTVSDGRLGVTTLTGSGLVQRQPGPNEPQPGELSDDEQQQAFTMLAERFKQRSTASDLQQTIDDVSGLLNGRLNTNKPAFAKAFRDAVNARNFNSRSGDARGFLLDCLKIMGFFPDAYLLIDRDTRLEIRVATAQIDFLKFLEAPPRGATWVGEALRHPDFRDFWPGAIVRAYRDFLFKPHSPPPGENTALRDRTQAELQRRDQINTSTELVPQERIALAWVLLHEIDLQRVEECNEAQSGTTAQVTATESRQRTLATLKEREQKILDDTDQPAFRRLLAEQLMRVVNEIAPIWEGTMAAYVSWEGEFRKFSDAQLLGASAEKFPHSPLTNPFLQTLRQTLVTQTQNLMALEQSEGNAPELPAPPLYEQRLGAWRDSLNQSIPSTRGRATAAPLLQQLDDAVWAAARAKRPVKETIRALTLLSLILDRVVQLSLTYDRETDAAMPHFPDMRFAHRIRMARALAWLARWMQWDDLLDACKGPLTADGEGKARLWLVSEWEPEAAQPIERLEQDFAGNINVPILRDSPITVRHLVEWFRLDYNTRLRVTLRELVRPEERATATTRVDVGRINALRQSREEVRGAMQKTAEAEKVAELNNVSPETFDLRVPQRFVVRDWEVAVPKGVEFKWERLIEEQDKTGVSLERHRSDGKYSVLLFPMSVQQGVFAWMVPSLRPLIALLRKLPSLRGIAGEGDVDDELWLKRLDPEQLSEAQWAEVNRRIQGYLERSSEQVERDLPNLWLRLNILRRRILVMQLRPALRAFVENRSVAYGPSGEKDSGARLMAPLDTTTALLDYDSSVTPRESAPVQTTLFLIGLADLLESVVTPEDPEPEFGRRIYPYLLTALDFLSGDAQKLQELRQGSNTYDEAGNIVFIDSKLQTATSQLRKLKTAIDNSYIAAQRTVGFRSENGKTIAPLAFATEIYPSHRPGDEHEWAVGSHADELGQIDTATGTRYRLLEVYRKFTYHPAVGALNGIGPSAGPRYIDENGIEYPRINEAGQREPIPHVPIFRFEIGGTPREVYADDGPLLTALNDAFLWRSFQIQMENLAFLSEEYMKWLVAVVGTVIPGVTYAEVATTAMQFILSGELEEIVRQLRNDPAEVLQRIIERLRNELFTPENVWRFVLLGGQHSPFEALHDVIPGRQRQKSTVPPTSRLGRILFRLRQLGRKINDALHRLRLYADGPIRSVQGFISMRPTLAWLLRRAAHLIEAAVDLVPPEVIDAVVAGKLPSSPKELADAVSNGIDNTAEDMEKSVVRLLETIHHFELPYELLDLAAATEIILGFIADRFGPRARAVRMVLQIIPIPQEHEGRFTGMRTLYQAICGEIAKVWEDTPVDPNKYWRSDVLPLIGTKFQETRDDLVDGLYRSIDLFLEQIGQPHLQRPSGLPETEVEAVKEAEASFSSTPHTLNTAPWRLHTFGGTPLPSPLRRSFESSFGQQFSHVRLHHGADARVATEPIGADAVTTGSHVFVAPSLSLTGASGRRLLGHELTHVVQQTGSYSLGGPRPEVRQGRPQRGLLLDGFREKQAESVGRRIASGQSIPKISAQKFAAGPQPALGERVVNSVIDTITVARKSSDFTETPHGGDAAHVPGIDVAKQLWTRTLQLIGEAKFAKFLQTPAGLGTVPGVSNPDVQDLIKQQLRDRNEELIGSQIGGIAQLAQRPRKNRKPDDPETELNPARFVNLLEDFISAERGIALEIEFKAADNTISQVRVNNVLLQNVGGTSGLWRIAMHASFSSHSADIPDLSAAQGEIRQRLRALPPSPLIYSFTGFQFSTVFVNDYLELIRSRGRAVDDIHKFTDYVDTTNKRADSLAVSTHGDLKAREGSFGRESHHTTQYLLVEFFGNLADASRPAFPDHHARYPTGVEFKAGNKGEVKGIRSGGRFLDVAALNPDKGRGNNMPAILLSKRAHQRGELHVLREARWEIGSDYDTERKGTPTQGFAIENTFNRNVPPDLRPSGDSAEHRQTFSKAIDHDDARANREFYNAAKATYHWMYNRMIPALKTGLQSEELAYYRGVASLKYRVNADSDELQGSHDMQTEHLMPVWRAAKKKNDEVMSAAGWPTP